MTKKTPDKTGKHGTKRRRLSKEEVTTILAGVGIDLDNLPIDDAGHAQRMFSIAEDEGANVAFLTREDGGTWAVFDTDSGMWSRQAPKQKIGSWVLAIGNLFIDWAETLKAKLRDDELGILTTPLDPGERGDIELLIDTLLTQAKRLRSSGGIGAVRSAAESFPEYHIPLSDFDTDNDRVVVKNGVIDLQTGTLLPHDPKFLFTRSLGVFYDPQAEAPHFHSFLATAVPNVDERAFLQKCFGYTLTGHNTEQVLWMLIGGTGTGKSTLINAIYNVFGKVKRGGYAMKAPRGLFRKDQAHWGDTATLINARMAVDAEFAEQTVIDAALIKMLTGEQDITANKKYGPHLMFDLAAKFWLMTNHLPRFDAQSAHDEAVFRRVFVVPMNVHMYAAAYKAGTYRDLPEMLKAEAPGILAWIVEGAKRWYAEPLHTNVPATIQLANRNWRQGMGGGDLIHEALVEAGYVFQGDKFTPTRELTSAVNDFLGKLSLPSKSVTDVGDWCNGRGLRKGEIRKLGGRGYHGIGL